MVAIDGDGAFAECLAQGHSEKAALVGPRAQFLCRVCGQTLDKYERFAKSLI